MNKRVRNRAILLATAILIITAASTRLKAETGDCGGAAITLPFTDVSASNIFFCSIAEAFFSGLANGTSATTYNPDDPVSREQMSAFVTRTMNQSVKRASRRAALDQFWTINDGHSLAETDSVGAVLVKSDGADLWVTTSASVARVRASDGRLLETWSGANNSYGVLVAMGKVWVTGKTNPGSLYRIDPAQAAGPVTTLTTSLGPFPEGIAFDGQHIWTTNSGSLSIVTVSPLSVTNVITGFTSPTGIIYDGANIWVTDYSDNTLRKVDSSGNVVMSVTVGDFPLLPCFDGTNIWVPNRGDNSVSVVRATGALAGTVLATITGNGLLQPNQAAFDGERILVTNYGASSVSLWKASDLTPIGTFATAGGPWGPFGVCSDGLNFWITFFNNGKLARF